MATRLTLMLTILLAAFPAFATNNDGLMSYARFLELRGLEDSSIEEKNCVTEAVLNTRTRAWDSARQVCELWIREQVTPGQPLKYQDGSQVYRATREWTEKILKPDSQPRTGLFMVKQDKQPGPDTRIKRYVTTGN